MPRRIVFPRGLRALNQPVFFRFFSAQLLALIGAWMQTVAQTWLVLQLTDSAFKLGLMGTLQFAPVLLFSLFTGAIADRLPKRAILITTQATLAAQALLLAMLAGTGAAHYWHVGVLAFVAGMASAIDMPARQAYVADLVGREDLVNAVALNSAAFNAARIVGPAIAGLVIARWGVVPAFAVNSVGFLVVVGTLVRMPDAPSAPARGSSVLAEIGEGVRYALRTPSIRLTLGLLFAVSFTVFNFTVYVPLLARHVLGLGAEGFGFLMASLGVGAVSGALALGSLRQAQPSFAALFFSASVACGGLTAMAFVDRVWLAVGLLFVIGFFGIMLVAACNTTLQLTAPDALRGRVMSLYALIWGGVFPIGAFLVGAISEAWGVRRAFLVMGGVGLTTLAALGVAWRRRR